MRCYSRLRYEVRISWAPMAVSTVYRLFDGENEQSCPSVGSTMIVNTLSVKNDSIWYAMETALRIFMKIFDRFFETDANLVIVFLFWLQCCFDVDFVNLLFRTIEHCKEKIRRCIPSFMRNNLKIQYTKLSLFDLGIHVSWIFWK